ncbi:hypothetical protein [Actinomycetospora sp. CA-053990]|uniref:hypothetical protein n=1 Tax=Actinomycetospora sp. CA-053990 TaxID=3239891 RepID=UPI003D8E6742
MLAVVILVPIAIMVLACVLERFEARAVPTARAPRTSRAGLRAPATTPATTPAPPLQLVPGAAEDDDRDVLPEPATTPATPLRRAS